MINESLVVLAFCLFAFVPLILGERARNYKDITFDGFVLQNRSMGILPMYFTVFATWMSAFAFLGGISYFFNQGPLYMTTVGWDMLFAVLFVVFGRRIWFYGKQHGLRTAIDFFDATYDSSFLSNLVLLITTICTLIYLQAQITAATLIVDVATDGEVSSIAAGILFFSILIIYLWAGGLRAVALTDIFYGLLIVIAMLCAGFFLMKHAGGTEVVFQKLIERNASNVSIQGDGSLGKAIRWIAMFMIVPLGAFMSPPIWIRNYASKSEDNFNILPLLLGISSIICIGTLFSGSALQILNTDISNPDAVILVTTQNLASPLFAAFIIIGMFAAIYSTANSQVHALASSYANDIHRRYINKNISDRKLVSITRWAVLFVCFISYVLMILVPQNLFDLAMIALGGMAQLIVPVMGALFWNRSSSQASITGIITGETLFFVFLAMHEVDSSICAIIALLMNAYMFILISYTGRKRADVSSRIQSFRNQYKASRKLDC